jgi:hypothetical protein
VQNVSIDQAGESIGQQVSCNTEVVTKLAKAMNTPKDVSHDEQGPAVTYEIERCLDGTGIRICGVQVGGSSGGGVDRGFCW